MLNFFKIVFSFTFLFLFLVSSTKGQKIDLTDYENKAQAYAILSAQFSNDAYRYSRQNFFLNSSSTIKRNCDTAIVCIQIALEYADSALIYGENNVDNAAAVAIMKKSIKYQNNAIKKFEQIRRETNPIVIHTLSETSMYASSNALAEAYKASLYFGYSEEPDELAEEGNLRDVTRLEADENSFNTVKEVYANRLIDVEKERALLEEELKTANGAKKAEIEKSLVKLNQDEKALLTKLSDSDDKLVDIKTELSEEMVNIVDKDVFTTEKEGFYDEKVPIPDEPKVQKGLVYKVQIGLFRTKVHSEYYDGIFPVSSQRIDDTHFLYVAGNFAKYEEAKVAKEEIAAKGYEDAFVIAYIDGKKVSILDAMIKEQQ